MQLKEKRDAAILEKHKEGMSNNAIAKMFNMTRQTVDNVVRDHAKNAESAKFASPESSTSAVPMASTEDRSDTREDARS
ncbi:helix-turn-helix domain-containing protein [Aeromonas veronii]